MFEAKFQIFSDSSDKAASRERLAALRREMIAQKLDGFLVPRADEHQGEYVPACDERLAWLTGFTGSAGFAVVFAKTAFIFSDGRYTLQVKAQVDAKLFKYVPSHETPVGQWLGDHAPEGGRIGYDARLHTAGDVDRLTAALAKQNAALVAVDFNPIDAVWQGRPAPPHGQISLHGQEFAGETVDQKINRVQASLAEGGADALIVSDPHNVAWLLNIRGSDVSHTPIALCYALVLVRGPATLFIDAAKVPDTVRQELPAQVEIAEPDELAVAVRQISSGGRTVRLDRATAGVFLKTMVERSGGKAAIGVDPITPMKARKNDAEMAGARGGPSARWSGDGAFPLLARRGRRQKWPHGNRRCQRAGDIPRRDGEAQGHRLSDHRRHGPEWRNAALPRQRGQQQGSRPMDFFSSIPVRNTRTGRRTSRASSPSASQAPR